MKCSLRLQIAGNDNKVFRALADPIRASKERGRTLWSAPFRLGTNGMD